MEQSGYLIVGLGNPGKEYEMTRHNIGFMVVQALAKKWNFEFRKGQKVKGYIAQGMVEDKKVYLLLPWTYMNLSGESVQLCMNFYQIEIPRLFVVMDDLYLPFGKFRLREKGSSGGHNGLKSIESSLKSFFYPRLKVGIGYEDNRNMSDYVIEEFTSEEKKELPHIIETSLEIVEKWIVDGIHGARTFISRQQTK